MAVATPINKVLRNTYIMLSLMLGVSAVTAAYAVSSGAGLVNIWLLLGFMIGMPFAIHAFRNSPVGLGLSFVYAGLFGYFLGPIVGIYASIDPKIPLYAFVATATIFGALSVYAMTTKRDMSFMGGFLMVGSIVLLLAIVANIFLQMPMFSIVISAAVVLLTAGYILYSTQAAARGGETNYITLATSLFGNIWVLFLHLMNLMNFASGND
jgi:modulator of FtsH protease